MEIEAKFALTEPVSAERVDALDWGTYRLEPSKIVDQHDTFFDTPDLALARSRYAVRLRTGGAAPVVTLKSLGGANQGIHSREEWEEPASDRDPKGWPASICQKLHDLIGNQTIEPLLMVHNQRRTWNLLRADQLIGEVALDIGTIEAGGAQEPMHELEIELKGGTTGDLAEIGGLVGRQLPAQPEDRSKFERGLALVQNLRSIQQTARGEQSDG